MEIKVSDIKQEIDSLSGLIEDYELTYLNLYNVVNNMSFSWEDHYADLFFTDVEKEKIKVANTVDEIKKIKDIYIYLVNKYNTLGNKIIFELKNKDYVLKKIDSCLSQFDSIIKSYQGLDLNEISGGIRNSIANELSKIKENKKRLEKYKTEVKNIITYIEETERNINLKISSIKIEIIKEQNIEEFV